VPRQRLATISAGLFLLSVIVSRSMLPDHPPPGDQEGSSAPTPQDYDAATQVVNGKLSDLFHIALAANSGPEAPLLAVIVADDIFHCEDLGRQLRELQNRISSDRLVVVTDAGSAAPVGAFIRREGVHARLVMVAPGEVLDDFPALPTPAVLLVGSDGLTADGIAHPRRFPNARLRSFAEELESIAGVRLVGRDEEGGSTLIQGGSQ
jgi:hypothetical protein